MRHRLLRQPVPPYFVPLIEQIMLCPSARRRCSRLGKVLLRHRANPLGDRDWDDYLNEAVDLGLVKTGSGGPGKEWVGIAVS